MKTAHIPPLRSLLDPPLRHAWPDTTTFSYVVTTTKQPVDNEAL
jgi:hypothetical protein